MGKGPRRLRAPASPGGQPGPSPDKPARPPQRTTCGSPRVSHIWRPTQSWSGMLLRRRFVAGPAPRPAPLGTPADEATSTHTGLDDYYYSYYYEPPARRPRLRCHVHWPATTRSPGKPWGPPQLAPTSTMTDWAVAPPTCRRPPPGSSSGSMPQPTPSTTTTTSSRSLRGPQQWSSAPSDAFNGHDHELAQLATYPHQRHRCQPRDTYGGHAQYWSKLLRASVAPNEEGYTRVLQQQSALPDSDV